MKKEDKACGALHVPEESALGSHHETSDVKYL